LTRPAQRAYKGDGRTALTRGTGRHQQFEQLSLPNGLPGDIFARSPLGLSTTPRRRPAMTLNESDRARMIAATQRVDGALRRLLARIEQTHDHDVRVPLIERALNAVTEALLLAQVTSQPSVEQQAKIICDAYDAEIARIDREYPLKGAAI
jgi:hypothetical protein